jgi:hypothetical protein
MQLEIAAKQLEALGNATRLAIYRDLRNSTYRHRRFHTTLPSWCTPD